MCCWRNSKSWIYFQFHYPLCDIDTKASFSFICLSLRYGLEEKLLLFILIGSCWFPFINIEDDREFLQQEDFRKGMCVLVVISLPSMQDTGINFAVVSTSITSPENLWWTQSTFFLLNTASCLKKSLCKYTYVRQPQFTLILPMGSITLADGENYRRSQPCTYAALL